MAGSQYRAAVIGLGFIGAADQVSGDALGQQVSNLDGTHAAALSGHDRVNLIAGASRDDGRRRRFEQRFGGVTAYPNWRDLLEHESLDIVSVATYAPQHAEIVIACAAAGVRAIFCEKPIATTMVDADRMVEACTGAGALLVVNHQRRFNPTLRRLRDFIAAGELGDLTSCNLQWGSGRLGNVGTHVIDALRMLTGREVIAVSGALDLAGKPDCRGDAFTDPGGWGMMRLEGGAICTVDAADYGTMPMTITINGVMARARVESDGVVIERPGEAVQRWPMPTDGVSSMDRAVNEIVHWLDDGGAFAYPGIEAARTLEAVVAFHASHARDAKWTALPLAGADRSIEVRSG